MNIDINFKLSQYNVYLPIEEKNELIIFNTLSRKEACIKGLTNEKNLISWLRSNKSIEKQKELEKLGILIKDLRLEKNRAYEKIQRREYQEEVLYLTILPTLDCNFRCIYCAQTGTGEILSDEDYSAIYLYIEKNIRKFHILRIGWFGGEPLLCKEKIINFSSKVKQLCKANGVLYISEITTNGYELDYISFSKLFRAGVRYYQITLDGNKKIHNYQRPHYKNNDSYERIISQLIEIKKREKSNLFEIGIRINVSNRSYPTLDSFIDTLYDYFGGDNRFKILWQWVRDWGGKRIEQEKEKNLGNDLLSRRLYEKSIKKGLQCKELLSEDYVGEACEAKYINAMVIGPGRKLYKCSMHLDDMYSLFGILDIEGTINCVNDNFILWHLKHDEERKCINCMYYPLCRMHSCPYYERKKNHNICMEFKNLIKVQMRMIYEKHEAIII